MKELDWANLPFGYMKTDYNVRITIVTNNGANWKFAVRKPFLCTWLPLVCTTVRKRLRV